MNEFLESSFKLKLRKSAEEGILIAVKWGLIIFLILWSYNYSMNTRNMAANGESAAAAIGEFQRTGWLPKLPAPLKSEIEKKDGKGN